MNTDDITPTTQSVKVWRGSQSDLDNLFGPLPGLQVGNVVAYEFELPERFVPAPGRTRVERTFVLLDVGVSFANPFWFTGIEADTWYIDLIAVKQNSQQYTFLDLYIDAFVPTDGRHYRQLDLDEFADAITSGELALSDAVDGLRRWQQFLDCYLHTDRWPPTTWADFPPKSIRQLREIEGPFATPVRYEE
ncbi:MAG: hypothetical protein AAGF95_30450 [Chloroflexota bacterium]